MADPSTAEPVETLHDAAAEAAPAERSQTPDVTASPSEAEKSDTKETLLEAVLKAVKPAEDADEGEPLAETSPPSESACRTRS